MAKEKNYRRTRVISPTVSLSAYAAGDAIDGIIEISEAVRGADQSGVIEQVVIVDESNQKAQLELYLFDSQVTGGTDNAPYAPPAGELKQSLGSIPILDSDYVTAGVRSMATVSTDFAFQMEDSQKIYLQIVTGQTPTYGAANALQIKFIIKQD